MTSNAVALSRQARLDQRAVVRPRQPLRRRRARQRVPRHAHLPARPDAAPDQIALDRAIGSHSSTVRPRRGRKVNRARVSVDFRFSFAYSRAMLPLTKRQREILDYLNDFIQQHGYAPSLEEIGRRFGLSSLATVHKHLTNLQEKGFIKRAWNRSRSVEVVPTRLGGRAVELPMLGLRRRRLADRGGRRAARRLPSPRISSASAIPTSSASRATR